MKYNYEKLVEFCNENEIKLIGNYSDIKITREYYITGLCKNQNCANNFNKSFRQLIKNGNYCNKCSIKNGVEKIKKSLTKFTNELLINYCTDNNIELCENYDKTSINEKTIIKGKCLTTNCNNIFNKSFRELIKLNGYCKICCKEKGKIKIKETNLKKYGVEYCLSSKEIKEKSKKTIFEKYGVEHISQHEGIKQQKLDKSIQKYGVCCPLIAQEVNEKTKKTNLEKYGHYNPQQNIDIQNKITMTNIDKYGFKFYFQTDEFKEKVIQTNLEKYGVSHHSQNSEIADKMLKMSYNKKYYNLPSGKIMEYQGYENFALDELLNIEKIEEDDIFTNRKDVPEIWYYDKLNKKRRHYVDIYIKSQNRCIEVKSTWTNQNKNNVFEKQNSAIDLGYKYEIWIYDKKGNKISVYNSKT
jgi:hypothetical protein